MPNNGLRKYAPIIKIKGGCMGDTLCADKGPSPRLKNARLRKNFGKFSYLPKTFPATPGEILGDLAFCEGLIGLSNIYL